MSFPLLFSDDSALVITLPGMGIPARRSITFVAVEHISEPVHTLTGVSVVRIGDLARCEAYQT